MAILYGIIFFIFTTLLGTYIFTASDKPLALRELAINTRKNPSAGSPYTLLQVLSIITKIFAVLVWIAGLVCAFLYVYYNDLFPIK